MEAVCTDFKIWHDWPGKQFEQTDGPIKTDVDENGVNAP